MMIVVSFLNILNIVGGVVFSFNVSVECMQTAGGVCDVVTSGFCRVFGNVLLALSKWGSSRHLL